MTQEEVNAYFKSKGAVFFKTYFTTRVIGFKEIQEPFMVHYFYRECFELGYYIVDLDSTHIFDEPRVWDMSIFNFKNYSNKIYL